MARILIVDDYPAILDVLEIMLTTAGHDVVRADDGAAGLAQASCAKPDLVILDIDMPEMDGVEACLELKRNPTTMHIPVLLMTGRLSSELLQRARQAGALRVLSKPFFRVPLLGEISCALPEITPSR
jgi:CheY-like chemotaxis protein